MRETVLFAAGLLFASVTLLLFHLRAWRQRDHGGLTDDDAQFFRRQFYRRMVTSSLLGVIGGTMLGSAWLRDLRWATIAWLAILLQLGGVLVLAWLDWWATRQFVQRHLHDHRKLREQILLEAQEFRDRHRG